MKKFIFPFILVILIFLEIYFIEDIKNFAVSIITTHPEIIIEPSNEYKKDYDFLFVRQSNDYTPYSKGDLRNIYYSVINNGWDEFTFYCPSEYELCVKDIQEMSDDDLLLTSINNYASPFNSFNSIQTSYDDSGEITITIEKVYDNDKINIIKREVEKIIAGNINDSMDDKTKILTIHDYIINNSEYDKERNNTGTSNYQSNNAYGPLIEHQAICSGYADLMAIFLDYFNIENYKIASNNHIWNAVKLNDKWYHLDLTWDDPVSSYGPMLDHKFFLIDNNELLKEDDNINEHEFDKTIYLEFNY